MDGRAPAEERVPVLAATMAAASFFSGPCFATIQCTATYRVTSAHGTMSASYHGVHRYDCDCRMHGHALYSLRRPARSPHKPIASFFMHEHLKGRGEIVFRPLGTVEDTSTDRQDGSSCHIRRAISEVKQIVDLYSDGRRVTMRFTLRRGPCYLAGLARAQC